MTISIPISLAISAMKTSLIVAGFAGPRSAAAAEVLPPDVAVHLGMTVGSWTTGKPADPLIVRTCGAQVDRALGDRLVLTTPERAGGATACMEGLKQANGDLLPNSGPLAGPWRAVRAEYDFRGGRMYRATWWTSLNAFDRLMADLHRSAGMEGATDRSRAAFGPRVKLTWRLPSERIILTAPAVRADELRISYEVH